MKYPAPDGTIIESSKDSPVVYTCDAPWADGIYESLETTSDSSNQLVQIKVLREVNQGVVKITITERTQQEISDYLNNLV